MLLPGESLPEGLLPSRSRLPTRSRHLSLWGKCAEALPPDEHQENRRLEKSLEAVPVPNGGVAYPRSEMSALVPLRPCWSAERVPVDLQDVSDRTRALHPGDANRPWEGP